MHKLVIKSSGVIDAAENTPSVPLRHIDSFSVQINVTAANSPNGINAQVQGSNDDTNWVNITDASVALSGTGTSLIAVNDCAYKHTRVAFSRTSGSVTASAIFVGAERQVRGR